MKKIKIFRLFNLRPTSTPKWSFKNMHRQILRKVLKLYLQISHKSRKALLLTGTKMQLMLKFKTKMARKLTGQTILVKITATRHCMVIIMKIKPRLSRMALWFLLLNLIRKV